MLKCMCITHVFCVIIFFFFHLTVPPVITTPPSVGQAVVGQQYRFECQASGKPAPEYLWFKVICAFLD